MFRVRTAAIVPLLLALPLSAGLVAGCGSSNHSSSIAATCTTVSEVLSDGADPTADPVGYAEAQIKPLAAIPLPSDKALAAAMQGLDRAFQAEFSSNGSKAASSAETAASNTLDAICPGATQ